MEAESGRVRDVALNPGEVNRKMETMGKYKHLIGKSKDVDIESGRRK